MYKVLSKDIIENEILAHLSTAKRGFKTKSCLTEIINCILYKLKTGIQWHMLSTASIDGSHTVALRAVTSVDAMTADWIHLPYEFLAKVSNEIINKERGVNRVVYDISSKPPATIEWE